MPRLHRRTLLLSAPLAMAAMALPDGAAQMVDRLAVGAVPLEGLLVACLRVQPDGGAEISVVRPAASGGATEPVAAWAVGGEEVAKAAAGSNALHGAARVADRGVRSIAAASWNVTPESCTRTFGRISHPSGRSVEVRVWAEFA